MRTLLNLFFILTAFQSISQTTADPCYDLNWDWMKSENWIVYINDTDPNADGTYPGINKYPFYAGEQGRDLSIIVENNDLDPHEGWVLLQKKLGCPNYPQPKPFIIFYNRYRGIIRLMIFNTFESSTSSLMTAEWMDGNRTSALTFSNIYSRANDSYPAYNNDMVMLKTNETTPGKWFTADFQVAFDEKTTLEQTSYQLLFNIYNVLHSTVSTNSSVQLTTEALEVKGSKSEKKGNKINGTRQWLSSKQKSIQKLKYNEWESSLKKAEEQIGEAWDWTVDKYLQNEAYSHIETAALTAYRVVSSETLGKTLKKGVKGLAATNQILKSAVDFIDFFVGKPSSGTSNKIALAPMQIKGGITTEGYIKTNTVENYFNLPLPGTDSNYPFHYYTCPLGVLNIKNTPTVDIRQWTEPAKAKYRLIKEKFYKYGYNDNFKYLYTGCPDESVLPCTEEDVYVINHDLNYSKQSESWKSLKLKDAPIITVNSGSNLKVLSAKVAFIGTVKENESDENEEKTPAYFLVDPYQLLPSDIENYRIYSPKDISYDNSHWGEYQRVAEGKFINLDTYMNAPHNDYIKRKRWTNRTFDYCNNNIYTIIEGGERINNSDDRNLFFKFRTEYVDIEKAKNLSFTVRQETTVTMKIIVVLQETGNDENPLLTFTNEYVINEPSVQTNTIDAPYPFIRNQLNNINLQRGTDFIKWFDNITLKNGNYTSKGIRIGKNVQVKASSNVNFSASLPITLNSGFSAESNGGNFKVSVTDDNSMSANTSRELISNVIEYYKNGESHSSPQYCDCFPAGYKKKNWEEDSNNFAYTTPIIEKIELYPVPATNILNIYYQTKEKEKSKLTILSTDGIPLLQKEIYTGLSQVNISTLRKGVYIVKIQSDSKITKREIIKL